MASRGIDRAQIAPGKALDGNVAEDAGRYLRAHRLLTEIRKKYLAGRITFQEYRTVRGQAVAGDVDGAMKGLARIEGRRDGW